MMHINKAYKFRLYPSTEQEVMIAKNIGCSRFIFNHFLAKWNNMQETTGTGLSYQQCSKELPLLKSEYNWLKEVDSTNLQTTVRYLADAFDGFFKKKTKHPRFKKKTTPSQSYTTKYTNGNIRLEESRIKIPKVGWMRLSKSREVEGRILSATISRKSSGKHYISLLVETYVEALPKTHSAVGIDVGIKTFATLSTDKQYENNQSFRKMEKQLIKAQRIMSIRQEQALRLKKPLLEASNYQKQKRKVARIHEKIANIRMDYLHKISTEIVKNHDIIGIEDLDVSELLQRKDFSKVISEASWSEFRRQLTYKCAWYGKQLVVVARNFPSSQRCSHCHYQHKDVKSLNLRAWTCPSCATSHDRDRNASYNLRDEALRLLTVGTTGIA